MNTSILQKCVDELKNESPDIRYILGMLETFIELSTVSHGVDQFTPSDSRFFSANKAPIHVQVKTDEGVDPIVDIYEKGRTGTIT